VRQLGKHQCKVKQKSFEIADNKMNGEFSVEKPSLNYHSLGDAKHAKCGRDTIVVALAS
jgi:hypothetical protein